MADGLKRYEVEIPGRGGVHTTTVQLSDADASAQNLLGKHIKGKAKSPANKAAKPEANKGAGEAEEPEESGEAGEQEQGSEESAAADAKK